MCCIAPVIAAKLFPNSKLTVGHSENDEDNQWPYAGTANAIQDLGAEHLDKAVTISFYYLEIYNERRNYLT